MADSISISKIGTPHLIERPKGGERAILIQLALPEIDVDAALREFKELALSAQVEPLECVLGSRLVPEVKYFIGKGKAEEVSQLVKALDIEVVLINHELSPSQERNLERLFQCRVVDRSGLILDIFAQRARTFEGKLQVELAQLEHLATRLIRGWTHLERQKGGIGLRGPGETQLETDRRLIRNRISHIQKRLDKVRRSHQQSRQARRKANLCTVSLVGYTNAGKSTLFNALTNETVYVADQLFATLDPTLRQLELPGAASVVLTDTVGFIRELPHQLIEAFRATLEETQQADLLLHVIDVSDPQWPEMAAVVDEVLRELNADTIPCVKVFNKVDKLSDPRPKMDYNCCRVWVSAAKELGLDLLKEAIATQLHGNILTEEVLVKASDAKRRAQLYALDAVLGETITPEGDWLIKIRISAAEKRRLFSS